MARRFRTIAAVLAFVALPVAAVYVARPDTAAGPEVSAKAAQALVFVAPLPGAYVPHNSLAGTPVHASWEAVFATRR